MKKHTDILRARTVPIREVWPHEAIDFTPWLLENLDYLSDFLSVRLNSETATREQSTGNFSVDILVENDDGQVVIIENQFGKSDHDHLGKIITYLTSFDAHVAIWIVEEARPEHVKAAAWINDSTSSTSMYLFKLEIMQIGDSPVSPRFTLLVGPSEDSKKFASAKGEESERHASRSLFFQEMLKYASSKTNLHSGRSGTSGPYLDTSAGVSGTHLTYGVQKHTTSVILWIERGASYANWNNALFEKLLENKSEIESEFGGQFEWEAKPQNRSRKLVFSISQGGWMDQAKWEKVFEETVDAMIRMQKAVSPYLKAAGEHASKIAPPEADVEEE